MLHAGRALSQYTQNLFQPPQEDIEGLTPDSWYSPLQPLVSFAPAGTEPRAYQYWAGQNLNFVPRFDAQYSAVDLQQLAAYPLARICIENVKDSVTRASWEIQPKPKPGETKKQTMLRGQDDANLIKLNAFFEYPDREHNWEEWLRRLLEDLLVIDAGTIMIRKTFNGDIVELPVLAGELITRYIDVNGMTPVPPSPAYCQNWWGMPLVNMTTDQLIYKPRNIVPRGSVSSYMYGCSPTEQAALEIQLGMKRLEFHLAYYGSGSVPGILQFVPRGTPRAKIEEAMLLMNSRLAGNLQARQQWQVAQGFAKDGEKENIFMTKEPLLADQVFDEKHIREIAFAYGTSPQRLMKTMNRASAEQSDNSADVEGTLPWVTWVKGVIDCIIQKKMGMPQYEMVINPFREPDPLKQAEKITMYVSKAGMTPNEGREELGLEPVNQPEADLLGVIGATGFTPLGLTTMAAGADGPPDKQGQYTAKEPPDGGNAGGGAGAGGNTPQAGGGAGKGGGAAGGGKAAGVKKKHQRLVEARIDPANLTPASHHSISELRAHLHKIFEAQKKKGLAAAKKRKSRKILKRSFHSVQFNLSPADGEKLHSIPVQVSDLAEKGRDYTPHVTVLFGLHPEVTSAQVNKITKGVGKIEVTLGKIEAFPIGKDGVPVVMRVHSERLNQLHADLQALPHTDTHPEYKSHITIAYIKDAEAAAKYVAAGHAYEGQTITLKQLVFSALDSTQTELQKFLRKTQEEDAQNLSDDIYDALVDEWNSLPAAARAALTAASLSGVGQGMMQIEVIPTQLIQAANTIAEEYATERAAEMIGKKYDEDGFLVDNPKAEWVISDTTRDRIKQIVVDAFKEETEMPQIIERIQQALSDESEGNGIFSEARAEMIAETEVRRAQIMGNYHVWEESGQVKGATWHVSALNPCDECELNDHETRELGEAFPSGAFIPGDDHPNCRCILIAAGIGEDEL